MCRLLSCCGEKSTTIVEAFKPEDTLSVTNKDEGIPLRYRLFGWPSAKRSVLKKEKKSVNVLDDKTSKKIKEPKWWHCKKKSTTIVEAFKPEDTLSVTNKDEGIPLRYRLFGWPSAKRSVLKKEKKSVNVLDDKTSKKIKEPKWWHCKKKRCKVVPSSKETTANKGVPHQGQKLKLENYKEEKEQHYNQHTETLRQQKISLLGFPNPIQICYMNSCLQALLTLKDFIKDIEQQEPVWNLIPDATVMKLLIDIKRARFSGDILHKLRLLDAFKGVVAMWNSEFLDLQQKDAHEFFTSVVQQISTVEFRLQEVAFSKGQVYSCPIKNHLEFKMEKNRKCRGCGKGSIFRENFTNLSLDLVSGGTVQEMLEDYIKDTELEFRCDCGATSSDMCSSFVNLPRIMVFHLKRFRYSPTFQLIKNNDPINISQDLLVPSKEGGACYSLVSIISHIGNTATGGHYICEGKDTEMAQKDLTDKWFTYNDIMITETSSTSVCSLRQRSSYVLLYKRQD